MSWKDILVIVSEAEADEPALALGEALAKQCSDCHLAAAFLTPLPDEPLAYEPTVVAGVWAELLGRARQEAEAEERRDAFRAYQLNDALLDAAGPDVLAMHCLPAHRGEEITSAVLIAVYIVKSLPLTAVRWLVVIVVTYTAVTLLRSARAESAAGATA